MEETAVLYDSKIWKLERLPHTHIQISTLAYILPNKLQEINISYVLPCKWHLSSLVVSRKKIETSL